MKVLELSLFVLATLASVLITASPLPSTCRCASPPATSLISRLHSQQRISSSSLCQVLCEKISERLALDLEETEVQVKLERVDAMHMPIELAERPIPTAVLMQLSSKSEDNPSAPSRTATPALCVDPLSSQDDRLGGRLGHARVQAQIDSFEQRWLVLILLGLLALFLVAVAIVESVEKLWER